MLKTLINRFLVFILTATMLCGCTKASAASEKTNVILIDAAIRCSSRVNYDTTKMSDFFQEAIDSGGQLAQISPDSSGAVLNNIDTDIASKYKSKSAKNRRRQAILQDAVEAFAAAKATAPENDPLNALTRAVRMLDGCTGIKIICMVNNGIGTTGDASYSNGLINADPDTLAEDLSTNNHLPDLSGVTVYWFGLGDTCEPQEPLTDTQMITLTDQWKAIVERAGGTLVIESELTEPASSADLPAVSTVDFPDELPSTYDGDTGSLADTPIELDANSIFEPDLSVLVDEAQTKTDLEPIVQYMNDNPDFQLLCVGCTAGDTNNEIAVDLAENRGNVIKNLLVASGISADRITVYGAGCENPWHISGIGTESDLAAQNRKVVLLNRKSTLAESILNG